MTAVIKVEDLMRICEKYEIQQSKTDELMVVLGKIKKKDNVYNPLLDCIPIYEVKDIYIGE